MINNERGGGRTHQDWYIVRTIGTTMFLTALLGLALLSHAIH